MPNGPKPPTPKPNYLFGEERKQYRDQRVLGHSNASLRYSDIPEGEIARLLDTVVGHSGCAILGITSDGGAYSLTVIVGTTRYREWPKNADEWLRVASTLSDELS